MSVKRLLRTAAMDIALPAGGIGTKKPVASEMHYSGRSEEHYLLAVKSSSSCDCFVTRNLPVTTMG
ncbi:hypothetical protein J3D54_002965 [Pseudomonas sp. GGS8]|uniref:hypothetical protein n=1 Tax=Pseudomonas sp. GGS8 TaxID=2817892 RepID=UPI0020A0D48C|nr:hypothetical protein [Pseudomonas sp. GGS8]MCP1443833.1 hypothetical protein [Pseudomonas sp. GGS8]